MYCTVPNQFMYMFNVYYNIYLLVALKSFEFRIYSLAMLLTKMELNWFVIVAQDLIDDM